jgi:hypothetical protein
VSTIGGGEVAVGVNVLVAVGNGVFVEVAVGELDGIGGLVGRGVRLGKFTEVGQAKACCAAAVHVAGMGPTGTGCSSETGLITTAGAGTMRVGTIGGFVWQPLKAISNIPNGHRRPNMN